METSFEGGDSDSGNVPLESILQGEERMAVVATINRLELKQRTVVILYYYNQLPTKETSCILGCLEGTVKFRLYTARKNLEQSLKEERTKVRKTESWIL